MLKRSLSRILKYAGLLVLAVGLFILGFRAYDSRRGPALSPWHTYIPKEFTLEELANATWSDYLKREEQIFSETRAVLNSKIDSEEKIPINRYFEGSRIYPGKLKQDWNRSYIMEPAGKPVGVVMMLHGLTDSPYSLRHIAKLYRDQGFVVVAIRLPGHGTVPAGLINVRWEEWTAATQLAANEARRRVPSPAPFHIVGFSNGGALAMQYALNSLGKEASVRPAHIVLISPMIGVTRFARLAGLAELPALLPSFAKSAWLGIVPEFNPFKYNSFPVNGARQSKRLTVALQQQISRMAAENALGEMPPVLTFQSVMDNTVSTPAIISNLYAYLPPNGSELVLFDVNRSVKFSALLRNRSNLAMARAMPPLPQDYRLTIIGNLAPGNSATVARVFEPGATEARVRALNLPYPADIFSLSHVAIPFPMDDPLYGMTPRANAEDEFGITLGALNARGERGALVINLDSMFRIASNPFFPYLLERVDENIADNCGHTARSPGTVKKIVRAPGGQKMATPDTEDMKREEERELQELGPLFAP